MDITKRLRRLLVPKSRLFIAPLSKLKNQPILKNNSADPHAISVALDMTYNSSDKMLILGDNNLSLPLYLSEHLASPSSFILTSSLDNFESAKKFIGEKEINNRRKKILESGGIVLQNEKKRIEETSFDEFFDGTHSKKDPPKDLKIFNLTKSHYLYRTLSNAENNTAPYRGRYITSIKWSQRTQQKLQKDTIPHNIQPIKRALTGGLLLHTFEIANQALQDHGQLHIRMLDKTFYPSILRFAADHQLRLLQIVSLNELELSTIKKLGIDLSDKAVSKTFGQKKREKGETLSDCDTLSTGNNMKTDSKDYSPQPSKAIEKGTLKGTMKDHFNLYIFEKLSNAEYEKMKQKCTLPIENNASHYTELFGDMPPQKKEKNKKSKDMEKRKNARVSFTFEDEEITVGEAHDNFGTTNDDEEDDVWNLHMLSQEDLIETKDSLEIFEINACLRAK